jgi:hypothetical protein
VNRETKREELALSLVQNRRECATKAVWTAQPQGLIRIEAKERSFIQLWERMTVLCSGLEAPVQHPDMAMGTRSGFLVQGLDSPCNYG